MKVFNGLKKNKYNEVDKMSPINKYGISKFLADKYIIESKIISIIIRTSSIFSGEKNCFLRKIYRNAKKNKKINIYPNNFMNPTYVSNLVLAVNEIINKNYFINKKTVIINFADKQSTTWFLFAKTFLLYLNKNVKNFNYDISLLSKVNNFHSIELKRPQNSALSLKKVSDKKIRLKFWKDSFSTISRKLSNEI